MDGERGREESEGMGNGGITEEEVLYLGSPISLAIFSGGRG